MEPGHKLGGAMNVDLTVLVGKLFRVPEGYQGKNRGV